MASTAWPEISRKREREEEHPDIAMGGPLGFEEHRCKRLQKFPVRTSPDLKQVEGPFSPTCSSTAEPAQHPFQPRNITPGDSDSDDYPSLQAHNFHHESQIWTPSPEPTPPEDLPTMVPSTYSSYDMDMMDMSEPTVEPQRPAEQGHLETAPLQPDPIAYSITGRIPTPINCNFASQVRGNNWGGAAGNVNGAGAAQVNAVTYRANVSSQNYDGHNQAGQENVPRSLECSGTAVMADWNLIQNRRLPSPISESGAEESMESPVMLLDAGSSVGSGQTNHYGHQNLLLSGLPPRASSAVELGHSSNVPSPQQCLRADSPTPICGSAMDIEMSATLSPRRGHTRSRHTLHTWTAQVPGMKRSFSIGYRPDCEKCQMKVPGHFNHIIIS